MKPQEVMQHPVNVLTDAERESFFRNGFVVLPDYVPAAWRARLRDATHELIERSQPVDDAIRQHLDTRGRPLRV